ncbi:hypothetical protein NBRC116596_31280 [Litorivita sp. NS0012-18]
MVARTAALMLSDPREAPLRLCAAGEEKGEYKHIKTRGKGARIGARCGFGPHTQAKTQ